MEETAASTEALEEQTEKLNANIAKFKVNENTRYAPTSQQSGEQRPIAAVNIKTYQSKPEKLKSPAKPTSPSATDWEEF